MTDLGPETGVRQEGLMDGEPVPYDGMIDGNRYYQAVNGSVDHQIAGARNSVIAALTEAKVNLTDDQREVVGVVVGMSMETLLRDLRSVALDAAQRMGVDFRDRRPELDGITVDENGRFLMSTGEQTT